MKRLECLDGLRGVLAVYVMLGHMAPFAAIPAWIAQPLSHGGAAVDVFFILSGLVITQSLESFGYRARPFLIARVVRIFPVYLVMFVLAVAVQPLPFEFTRMPWIGPDSPARGIWSEGWPAAWVTEIATHLTMTHGLWPNGILPDAWVGFLGAAWSLSTEWQFYLLALVLGSRLGGANAGLFRLVLIFMALGAAGLVWHFTADEAWQFSRAFLPNKAQYFALGVSSALLARGGPKMFSCYIGSLGASLILCLLQGGADKLLPPLAWSLCLAAQLHSNLPGLGCIAAILRTRSLQWAGAASYCIYLANEPIQKLLGVSLAAFANGDARLFTLLWLPTALLLPMLVAAWLHVWIEVPALRWGRAYARKETRLGDDHP